MTRKFNTTFTCQHCQGRSTAESGFGRWMRNHPALDSVQGIVRIDFDHIVLRFKTSLDGRDFKLMMFVEAKENGAEPDPSQREIMQFVHQLVVFSGKNMYNAYTGKTRKLKSNLVGACNVRYMGYHLLQFEKTSPTDSKWIKWNRKEIDVGTLVGLLALERHPYFPSRTMIQFLRDRHRKDTTIPLFPGEAVA